MQYLPAKYKNNNNLINNIRNQSIGFTLLKYMYKRQRLFTSIELTTVKVPEHIWVVYKVQGDYSMLRGLPKKDIQPERTKKIYYWQGNCNTISGSVKDHQQIKCLWLSTQYITFLNNVSISLSNMAILWSSQVSMANKSASISWNSSSVMRPAEWNLDWSLKTDPLRDSHALSAALSGICVINLNIRLSRWWMSNSSSKRRGSKAFPLLKIIIECTQYQWLNHLINNIKLSGAHTIL